MGFLFSLFLFVFPHITDTQAFRANYILAGHLVQFILKETLGKGFKSVNTIKLLCPRSTLHSSWNDVFSPWVHCSLMNGKILVFPVMIVCRRFSFLVINFLLNLWTQLCKFYLSLTFPLVSNQSTGPTLVKADRFLLLRFRWYCFLYLLICIFVVRLGREENFIH